MTHTIVKAAFFIMKGAALGFALGIAGAVFGTIIGSSFSTIWTSGMPLAMAFLGAMIFSILATIGMHQGIQENFHHN
jgi:hypothetical protein